MPSYLTPGVYVEEVPSQSKPIEGVGTAVAAFVGVAPGGPANQPMRISNWTQFAKLYGDPAQPENGPFMEGATSPTPSTATSRTAAACAGSCASASTTTGPSKRQAALPGRLRQGDRGVPRASRKDGVDGDVQIELVAEQAPAKAEGEDGAADDADLHADRHGRRRSARSTTASRSRRAARTSPPRSTRPRRSCSIEETAAAEAAGRAGQVHAAAPSAAEPRGHAARLRGRRRQARGHGRAWPAVDEITMVCVPDLMALAGTATTPRCATSRAS